MTNKAVIYSMYKPAGSGWAGNELTMLYIYVMEEDHKPSILSISDGETKLVKTYLNKTGEVYDNFMWLASLVKIDYIPILSAGFSRCDQE